MRALFLLLTLPLLLPFTAAVGAPPEGFVLVPAGEFRMGVDAGSAPTNDSPEHGVVLDAYYIGRHEVTNGEYAKFIAAKGYGKRDLWSDAGRRWLAEQVRRVPDGEGGTKEIPRRAPDGWEERKKELGEVFPDYPVTGVSWFEAEAFARFAGARLPTEAEWERAARGTDGRRFPWGDDFAAGHRKKPGDEPGKASPVGVNEGDVSPVGARDMGTNVAEWTASWFEPYPETKYESRYWGEDARMRLKVARGGSWRFIAEGPRPVEHKCTTHYRLMQYRHDRGYPFVGFRLAKDAK